MEAEKFLSIDDQSISLRQAIAYLRTVGELPRFLQKILHQHVLEQELQSRSDLEVDPNQVEQAMVNFRLQNKLTESGQFESWLQSQGLNYAQFRERISMALKLEKLKIETVGREIEEHFQQNQALFDRVVLSRIVVADPQQAQNLKAQILDGSSSFEDAAKAHSITDDRAFGGAMGALAMGQLPPAIRDRIAGKAAGEVVGPFQMEGRYMLLRIEDRLPTPLDNNLRRQLQEQFFDRWVQEKLKDKQIQLHLN
ncbi:MAG TPA: peptidylprolyl isomerase [Oscillatoriales cyanobacterium M59_W2019_021]|nr:peptidylprolyl isomerase [Oscillatoriales cyanobacterium M4454_W2019_049]HIK50647.1 peptidylprolyl isomerase [Oscillatoriales cyanobacterium M59_W2019_021]